MKPSNLPRTNVITRSSPGAFRGAYGPKLKERKEAEYNEALENFLNKEKNLDKKLKKLHNQNMKHQQEVSEKEMLFKELERTKRETRRQLHEDYISVVSKKNKFSMDFDNISNIPEENSQNFPDISKLYENKINSSKVKIQEDIKIKINDISNRKTNASRSVDEKMQEIKEESEEFLPEKKPILSEKKSADVEIQTTNNNNNNLKKKKKKYFTKFPQINIERVNMKEKELQKEIVKISKENKRKIDKTKRKNQITEIPETSKNFFLPKDNLLAKSALQSKIESHPENELRDSLARLDFLIKQKEKNIESQPKFEISKKYLEEYNNYNTNMSKISYIITKSAWDPMEIIDFTKKPKNAENYQLFNNDFHLKEQREKLEKIKKYYKLRVDKNDDNPYIFERYSQYKNHQKTFQQRATVMTNFKYKIENKEENPDMHSKTMHKILNALEGNKLSQNKNDGDVIHNYLDKSNLKKMLIID